MNSCKLCGARLKVRLLVDPPDNGGPNATLECSDRQCRALYDGDGRFIREHPITVLRRR